MNKKLLRTAVNYQTLVSIWPMLQRLFGRFYELSLHTDSGFRLLLSVSGLVSLVCRAIRKLLIRIINPIVLVQTPYGLTYMPLSHELPTYYYRFPLYDSVVTRLSSFIRRNEGAVFLIDIGANIGDTALCARLLTGDCALLVEPTETFRACASVNIADNEAKVELLGCLIGASDSKQPIQTESTHGTARIRFGSRGQQAEVCTLDTLLSARPGFSPNLIKIDTDGHDLDCLDGAVKTIAAFQPYVLFEADVFDSEDYCEHFFSCCRRFSQCGYDRVIFYSNIGHLLWRGRITDTSVMAHFLLYHLIYGSLYYDVLLIPKASSFPEAEISFFSSGIKQVNRRTIARSCLPWVD